MMHFTFDKDRYHEQTDMSSWCTKNIGTGKWISEPFPKDWTGLPDWTIHCMFGQTTIAFKHEKDYHWFLLRWA